MLCQFIVKNYKSIKNEIVFDMQAATISEHKDSLIIDKDGEAFLPVAAIYGPNGSGKSNVLEALFALQAKIMKPICSVCEVEECGGKNKKVSIVPFKFSPKSINEPTEFTLFFRTEKSEYRYILHVLKEIITYESLDKKNIDGIKYTSLYERKMGKTVLRGPFKKFSISEDISDNITTISFLAITNKRNEYIRDIIGWFEGGIDITNFSNPFKESRISVPTEEEEIELAVKILQEMDIDITGIRCEEEEDDDDFEVYSKHVVLGKEYELPIFEESAGTKKILGFLPNVLSSLADGRVLCVDELDSKLHPVLIRYLINLYTNKNINKRGAQLIFTSHDLANMNNEVYRRDEIWFVAKNNEQSSDLYSLVEIKDSEGISVRKDARYDKQYLEGKYGADPFLKKIVNWGDYSG